MKNRKRKKAFALIEVVIALGIIVVLFNISYIKVVQSIYDLRYYGDIFVSEIRKTHQHSRATTDISCKVEIITLGSSVKITTYENNSIVNEINFPSNIIFTWAPLEDGNTGKYNTKVDIKFNYEGISYTAISGGAGLTMFLTDKETKKYIKITIVPTTGRVHCYEYF